LNQDNLAHGNVKQDNGVILFNILDKSSTPVNADDIVSQIKHTIDSHWTSTRAQGIGVLRLTSTSNPIMDNGDDTIMRTLEYNFSYSNLPGYKNDTP